MAKPAVSEAPGHRRGDYTHPAAEATRIPAITIHAFCNTPELIEAIEAAAADRRMARVHLKLRTGGTAAATEFYHQNPNPHLIIIESRAGDEALITELDSLAKVCEAETKVMVIGASNDIALYRNVLERGVSEYLVAPVDAMQLIGVTARLYRATGAERLGTTYAFVGAKGGVGSSTIAHNVAWTTAHLFGSDVVLGDMDLPFGTAGLDFNLEAQGMAGAIKDFDRLDEVLLDRLMTKYDDHLRLLGSPAALEGSSDLDEGAVDRILDVMQSNNPLLVLDVPHVWASWAKKTLIGSDDVVITATPDLASLRNTKNVLEFLRNARPNDAPPKLILNQVGTPKRPEIKAKDFAKAVELEPIAIIPFDPQLFGTAANKGQMIGDHLPKSKIARTFAEVAQTLTGRKPNRRSVFRRLFGR